MEENLLKLRTKKNRCKIKEKRIRWLQDSHMEFNAWLIGDSAKENNKREVYYSRTKITYAHIWRGFPGGLDGEESACNAADLGLTRVREVPLEKGVTTHASSLAWRTPWTEEAGRLQSMGHKELGMTEQLTLSHTLRGHRITDSEASVRTQTDGQKEPHEFTQPWTPRHTGKVLWQSHRNPGNLTSSKLFCGSTGEDASKILKKGASQPGILSS